MNKNMFFKQGIYFYDICSNCKEIKKETKLSIYENSPLPMLTLLATVTAAGDVHCLWGYLVFTVSLLSSTSSLYS